MYAHIEKPKENKSRAITNFVVQKKNSEKEGFRFVDNRPKNPVIQRVKNTVDGERKEPWENKKLKLNVDGIPKQMKTEVAQMLTDDEIEARYNHDMNRMSESQRIVIQDIITIDGWQAFRGGHVVINSPNFFLKWMRLDIAKRKQGILKGSLGSSHYTDRDADQFEIQLPNFWFGNNWGTVLFGSDDTQTSTWFQVEGHSGTFGGSYIRFFTDVLMHGADFIKHKRYGLSLFGWDVVNVGPFGTDEASEKSATHRLVQ